MLKLEIEDSELQDYFQAIAEIIGEKEMKIIEIRVLTRIEKLQNVIYLNLLSIHKTSLPNHSLEFGEE